MPEQQTPPTLLVYDLTNDQLLRNYQIPEDQRTADSLFANIAVEDYDCSDSYGYFGDLGGPGLVVYSWKLAKSWLVKHHYFHPDPQVEYSCTIINYIIIFHAACIAVALDCSCNILVQSLLTEFAYLQSASHHD